MTTDLDAMQARHLDARDRLRRHPAAQRPGRRADLQWAPASPFRRRSGSQLRHVRTFCTAPMPGLAHSWLLIAPVSGSRLLPRSRRLLAPVGRTAGGGLGRSLRHRERSFRPAARPAAAGPLPVLMTSPRRYHPLGAPPALLAEPRAPGAQERLLKPPALTEATVTP
ncbi:hypothetical protein DSL92_00065 [Billgrantia gudaonensis]|uniref:Uncharacterized protein n=1 Tax=Billgrantia gudaonensis TaxID=376427 RepID=A0A432JKW3_9GAMM|nr:hypothetical protein DSL92_00065 [Halomonas gudaonensis]